MKQLFLILTATISLPVMAQAGPKTKPISKPTGTVIVYRQWGYAGAVARFQFNIDHGPSYFVRNGNFVRVTWPPGDHIISHDHTFLTPQDPQRVHVEAGKKVYFQYTTQPMLFAIFEIADDQVQAAETVSGMQEQK